MLLFALLCILLFALFFYATRNNGYWKKRNVKYLKPYPLMGSIAPYVFARTSVAEFFQEIYRNFPNEKLVGYYNFTKPAVVIRDPDLANKVLTTDFYSFHYRGIIPKTWNLDQNALFKNLFEVDGDEWKLLRQKLSPLFSSGKVKAMFPLIVDRALKMQSLAKEIATKAEPVDIRELMARYTTDFIGACAFGIDLQSLDEEDSDFRKIGKNIFQLKPVEVLKYFIILLAPFNVPFIKFLPDVEEAMYALLRNELKRRNYKPSGRNDFIDMLLSIQNKGPMVRESIEKKNPDGTPFMTTMELNESIMMAQIYVFFAAGFETSSSASSFALHLLAFHPEEQDKVHEEIDRVISNHNNELSYESVKDMVYLEMVLNESMRLLPPVSILNRTCTMKYTFPGTGVTIDKGVEVVIPTYAYHHDPELFEDPEEFRPMRFHPDNANKLNKNAYLPFGEGYRSCVGARLGQLQAMAGLAALLQHVRVKPTSSSHLRPKLSKSFAITSNIEGGLPLMLELR